MARQQDVKILEYSQVVKTPKSEGMLVCQCSIRLRELGLTLLVVSILMYDQEFHNKKMFLRRKVLVMNSKLFSIWLCFGIYVRPGIFLLHFADLSLILVLQCSVGFKPCLPRSRDHQTSHCISIYIFFML